MEIHCLILYIKRFSSKKYRNEKQNPVEASHPLEKLANAAGPVPSMSYLTINVPLFNAHANEDSALIYSYTYVLVA